MAMTKQEAIKALQTGEFLYVAYAHGTKLPYVTCDEESFNDQAWIFATEEEIKEYGKKKLEDKLLLMGMRYERKDFPKLYGLLYSVGINSVVWNKDGERMEIDLAEIAKPAYVSKIEPAKRPLMNPSLQLSAMYFMQELRRPVQKEERKNMRELEEELVANLVKAEFLVGIAGNPEDPKKINIPYLKNKEGKILQPVFTDIFEFEKFARGKQLRAAKVPFAKLLDLLMKQADGIAVNPMGFNLMLNKDQVKKMMGIREN